MTSAHYINDPKHWRGRAEEMRVLADEMKDAAVRETMLRIAADYERLAKRAEQRSAGQAPLAENKNGPAGNA